MNCALSKPIIRINRNTIWNHIAIIENILFLPFQSINIFYCTIFWRVFTLGFRFQYWLIGHTTRQKLIKHISKEDSNNNKLSFRISLISIFFVFIGKCQSISEHVAKLSKHISLRRDSNNNKLSLKISDFPSALWTRATLQMMGSQSTVYCPRHIVR